MLSTASLSALGYQHGLEQPVIRLWNETHYLEKSDDRNYRRNSAGMFNQLGDGSIGKRTKTQEYGVVAEARG